MCPIMWFINTRYVVTSSLTSVINNNTNVRRMVHFNKVSLFIDSLDFTVPSRSGEIDTWDQNENYIIDDWWLIMDHNLSVNFDYVSSNDIWYAHRDILHISGYIWRYIIFNTSLWQCNFRLRLAAYLPAERRSLSVLFRHDRQELGKHVRFATDVKIKINKNNVEQFVDANIICMWCKAIEIGQLWNKILYNYTC